METKTVMMPRELTAANGAKALLSGEFFEEDEADCMYYDDVCTDKDCGMCHGSGVYIRKIPVSWTTIKAIYAMAVKNLGN